MNLCVIISPATAVNHDYYLHHHSSTAHHTVTNKAHESLCCGEFHRIPFFVPLMENSAVVMAQKNLLEAVSGALSRLEWIAWS